MQKQFNQILTFSQGIKEPQTDELFKLWQENKVETFKDLFPKGQYIYELPEEIVFSPGKEALTMEYNNFLQNEISSNDKLFQFLLNIQDDFYTNTLSKDYDKDGVCIKKGTKIIKAFKYFISDPKTLAYMQDKASTLIQKTKIKGKLCLSIHPLDFLSLSENNHNWRSCHSLDGCYRAGNLSYMADSSTLICYLKSDEDVAIHNFPESIKWNSKKWRMLLFVSEAKRMIFAGRQYPYSLDDTILSRVFELLQNDFTFSPHTWGQWDNTYIDGFNSPIYGDMSTNWYYLMGEKHSLVSIADLINSPNETLHYNDLLFSSVYKRPYYAYKLNWFGRVSAWSGPGQEKFNIGSDIPCICCGKNHIDKSTETMLCEDCFKHKYTFTCEHCGCLVEEEPINFQGDNICSHCYDNTMICSKCGERNYIDEGEITTGNKFICHNCLQEEEE